jgi:hypothetical protein
LSKFNKLPLASKLPRFYRNFLIKSDNGRFSLRVANTFSLEITSIKLKRAGSDIRLHLKPKMPLSIEQLSESPNT